MPRLHGYKERIHQPLYDHLIRTTGTPSPTIQSTTHLFGNTNVGDIGKTNLDVAGQLASDQTYIVLAMRCFMYFDSDTDSYRRDAYCLTHHQLYFTVKVGDKPQFLAPA
jgi:hypothetical protein